MIQMMMKKEEVDVYEDVNNKENKLMMIVRYRAG